MQSMRVASMAMLERLYCTSDDELLQKGAGDICSVGVQWGACNNSL